MNITDILVYYWNGVFISASYKENKNKPYYKDISYLT